VGPVMPSITDRVECSSSRTGGLSRARGAYEARVRQLGEEGARLEDELHELLVRAEATVGTGPRLRVRFTSAERIVLLRCPIRQFASDLGLFL
jgi:hypothetical protein